MQRRNLSIYVLLILTLFVTGGTYTDTNPFILGFHHLLVTIVVILWAWRNPLPRTALDAPLVVIAIWFGVTTLTSLDWRVSLEQNWRLLSHILIFYGVVWWVRRGQQKVLFQALFLAAALVVLVSLVELLSWYFGFGFAGRTQGWFEIGGLLPFVPRLSLALNVATWLGGFAAIVLPLTLVWSVTARLKADRQALRLLTVGLFVVFVLSQSRGALIGFGASGGLLACYGLYTQRDRLPRMVQLGLAGAIVAAGVAVIGVVVWLSAFRESGDQGRRDLWQTALEIVQDNPITGVGVAQFPAAFYDQTQVTASTAHLPTAHNLMLNTASEVGIVGVLLLVWLVVAFLWQWWQIWQVSHPAQQWRLVAIVASLGAFAAQSMVDTFVYTSTLLPLLLVSGFVMAGAYQKQFQPSQAQVVMPRLAIVGVVAVYGMWMLSLDIGRFRAFQAQFAIAQDDLPAALNRIEQAQAIDPYYERYDLEQAYILGLLAETYPDQYLNRAIESHETVLNQHPNFDIGFANLAALYAQRENYNDAIRVMERAVALRPDIERYAINLGRYYEANGELDAAIDMYLVGLDSWVIPTRYNYWLADSDFWDNETPTRTEAVQTTVERSRPFVQAMLHIALGTPKPELSPDRFESSVMLGMLAVHDNDYQSAVEYFEATIADYSLSSDNHAWLYAQIAWAQWQLGNRDAAEVAARTAIYFDAGYAGLGYQTLAALYPDDPQVNDWLIQGIQQPAFILTYTRAAFYYGGFAGYLPQNNFLGRGEAYYVPWFTLAERYTTDDDPDTDPWAVYEAIAALAPYLQAIDTLCVELTAPPDSTLCAPSAE